MDPQTHLKPLQDLLRSRQADLLAQVHAAQQAHQEPALVEATDVSDQKDVALQAQLGVIDNAQLQRDIEELAQVEAALQRLDAGAYGSCVDCNEPIALERLQVQPAAQRCARCQVGFERRFSRAH